MSQDATDMVCKRSTDYKTVVHDPKPSKSWLLSRNSNACKGVAGSIEGFSRGKNRVSRSSRHLCRRSSEDVRL